MHAQGLAALHLLSASIERHSFAQTVLFLASMTSHNPVGVIRYALDPLGLVPLQDMWKQVAGKELRSRLKPGLVWLEISEWLGG
jgi:hypothetical protein